MTSWWRRLACAVLGHDRYDEAEAWCRARAAAFHVGDESLIWHSPRWQRQGRAPLRICLRCKVRMPVTVEEHSGA